jgi:hypothetical protein
MYDQTTFCELLDRLVEKPAIVPACRACGIAPNNWWKWIDQSFADETNNVESRFKFIWSGTLDYLHRHYVTARKRNVVLFDSHLRDIVVHGQRREIVHDGRIVYAHDPKLLADAQDADVWKLLHGDRPISDTYLRGDAGELVRETILEPTPAMLQARAAAALMPNVWSETRKIEMSGNLGTTVIGAKPAKQAAVAAAIEDDAHDDDAPEPKQQVRLEPEHDRPDILALKKLVAERANAKPTGTGYQTLAMRGDPRAVRATRDHDPEDRTGPGTPLPGGHRVA